MGKNRYTLIHVRQMPTNMDDFDKLHVLVANSDSGRNELTDVAELTPPMMRTRRSRLRALTIPTELLWSSKSTSPSSCVPLRSRNFFEANTIFLAATCI